MPRERGGKSSPSLAVLSEGFSGNTEAERRIENIHDDRRREESFPYEIYIGKNNPTKIVALMDTGPLDCAISTLTLLSSFLPSMKSL